jgi:histidinol-phosphate/aromatic aminotransferase/cobyric acid decarboxylase-like protein
MYGSISLVSLADMQALIQYKEYYRSAETAEMKILSGDSTERANVLCIVNPCNPTGDYMPLDQIKTWINDNVYDGGFVIVGRFIDSRIFTKVRAVR